jgi:hypothetical protein
LATIPKERQVMKESSWYQLVGSFFIVRAPALGGMVVV